jgi:hypothetical protein
VQTYFRAIGFENDRWQSQSIVLKELQRKGMRPAFSLTQQPLREQPQSWLVAARCLKLSRAGV